MKRVEEVKSASMKSDRASRFFIAVILMELGAMVIHSDEPPELGKGFRSFVESEMASWNVPGLAIAAVRHGRVVLMGTFGLRDVEGCLPVTIHTRFPIASCTKAFTATVAGMLVDGGLVDLDAPLTELLPEFRLHDQIASRETTLRDLLTHRTGVPAYDALWYFQELTREEIVKRVAFLEPSAPFRDRFQYSNLLYVLAGVAIGRAAGECWEQAVADRIFEPLGMTDATFTVDDPGTATDRALPYTESSGRLIRIPFRHVESLGPASSINASIRDMARWLQFQLDRGKVAEHPLISSTSLDQIHGPQMAIRDPEIVRLVQARLYGQGWYVSNHRGHDLVEHAGGLDGFSAIVSFLPKENVGVVVLTNKHPSFLMSVVARKTLDRLLGLPEYDWSSLFKELLAGYLTPANTEPVDTTTWSRIDPLEIEGLYRNPAFGRVVVAITGEEIEVEVFGRRGSLEPCGEDEYRLASSSLPPWRIRFRRGPGGEIAELVLPLEPKVNGIEFSRETEDEPTP